MSIYEPNLDDPPIFKNNLHSSQGKSERIDWIINECKKSSSFHFEQPAYSSKRCTDVKAITTTIEDMCRSLRVSPNTRRDYTEQVLFELKII